MSSKLEDFLDLGNIADIQDEISVNIGGKDLTLRIRAMTETEHKDFQKRSTIITKKNVDFDTGKYNSLMIPACIIEPNFNSADFLAKAKCQTAWDFINCRFPAGVIEDIGQKIQELSGFKPMGEEIDEAKN